MKEIKLIQDKQLSKEYYPQFITPSDEDINSTVNNIFKFLKRNYPELDNKSEIYTTGTQNPNIKQTQGKFCVEIRPLMRRFSLDEETRHTFRALSNPSYQAPNFRLFSFSENQKHKLFLYIRRLLRKRTYFCLYYSIYIMEHGILTRRYNGAGDEYPPYMNMISTQNAYSTRRLLCDFDHVSPEQFKKIYDDLVSYNLKPSTTVFSGHGYQCIFRLNKSSGRMDIQKEFTEFLLANRFPVDEKIKDCARIMRMPYTWNCKEYSNEQLVLSNSAKAHYTYIVEDTDTIYDLDDLEIRIRNNTINTTSQIIQSAPKDLSAYKLSPQLSVLPISPVVNSFLQVNYSEMNIGALDDVVKKMLLGFQSGTANNVLMFLVSYLKENGYALDQILKIVDTLKALNTFKYAWISLMTEPVVNRFYYNYSDSPSKVLFDKNKLTIFGEYNPLDYQKEYFQIFNYWINNISYYKPSGLYLYLTMYFWRGMSFNRIFSLKSLSNISGLSERTVYRIIKPLLRTSSLKNKDLFLIDKKKNKSSYYQSIISSPLEKEGFFRIRQTTLSHLLDCVVKKELNTTEFCILLILKKYAFTSNQTCVSQQTIALLLGFNSTGTVCRSVKHLEDLKFLTIQHININSVQVKNLYTLNY